MDIALQPTLATFVRAVGWVNVAASRFHPALALPHHASPFDSLNALRFQTLSLHLVISRAVRSHFITFLSDLRPPIRVLPPSRPF